MTSGVTKYVFTKLVGTHIGVAKYNFVSTTLDRLSVDAIPNYKFNRASRSQYEYLLRLGKLLVKHH